MPMILGVCSRLSKEFNISDLVFKTIFLLGLSIYILPTIIIYLLLAFLFIS